MKSPRTKPARPASGDGGVSRRTAIASIGTAVCKARSAPLLVSAGVSAAGATQTSKEPRPDWIPLILSTGSGANAGKDMPPGACKHLRWDYHAASQTVYVCGGDWNSPAFPSGGGDYNTVMFKYTGNGKWTRDYPQHLGTALYDCNIGPAGDLQPPPHCEATFSWAGGDKFISADYRTDWNKEGPFPAAWTTGVSRSNLGFATMTEASQPMEYDRVTRKWSKRSGIPHIGQARLAEMATFDATRNLWIRTVANQSIHTTNTLTGETFQFNNCAFPNHPADGRSPTYRSFYRPVIVGSRCFMYNPNPFPDAKNRDKPWPVYIWYFNLSDLDNHTPGFHLPIHWFCTLWEDAAPPVIASEQDMLYVPPENALLIWGEPAFTNVANSLMDFKPSPKANPESYFVDVDTGAKRPGPPLPRGRNGAAYRPNNTIYYPPTQEIIAHGNAVFRDPYRYASSESSENSVDTSRQYTIYKRTANLPAWAASLAINEWHEIPNTSILTPGGNAAKIDAWNGLAFRRRGSYLYNAANGGHTDYGGNEVEVLCLSTDTPKWYRVRNPSATVPKEPYGRAVIPYPYYKDGTPASRHTYYSSHFIESANRIFLLGRGSSFPWNDNGRETDAFDLDKGVWDSAQTWALTPLLNGAAGVFPGRVQAQHPTTDDCYMVHPAGALIKFSASTLSYTLIPSNRLSGILEGGACIDPVRNRMLTMCNGFGCQVTDLDTAVVADITPRLNGPGWIFLNIGFKHQNSHGLVYDEANDVYLAKPYSWFSGSTNLSQVHPVQSIKNAVVRINPKTWYCDLLPTTGTVRTLPGDSDYSNTPGGGDSGGPIYTRFRYVPEMKGLVYYPIVSAAHPTNSNVYFMRTA